MCWYCEDPKEDGISCEKCKPCVTRETALFEAILRLDSKVSRINVLEKEVKEIISKL